MRKWNFTVKSNPQEISKKLKSSLGSLNGFVFHIHHHKDSVIFKMRKRILYAWYLIFFNSLVVHGKLAATGTNNETDVEITFRQHYLWIMVILTHASLGVSYLIIVASGKVSSTFTYIIGVITLIIGVLLWIRMIQKYRKNIQEYKALITKVLENNSLI